MSNTYRCANLRCSLMAGREKFATSYGDSVCPNCGADAFPVNSNGSWKDAEGIPSPLMCSNLACPNGADNGFFCKECSTPATGVSAEAFAHIANSKKDTPVEYTRAQQQAIMDYESKLGTVVEVKYLRGFVRGDAVDIMLDAPINVRVAKTELDMVLKECSGTIDPMWYVDLVNPQDAENPDLKNVRALCMFAPCYDAETGERISDE